MPPLRTRGMPRTGKRVALGKRCTCHQLQLTEDDQRQYDEAQRIRSKLGFAIGRSLRPDFAIWPLSAHPRRCRALRRRSVHKLICRP